MIVTKEMLDAERAEMTTPHDAYDAELLGNGWDACLAFLRTKGTNVPTEMDHGVVLVPGFVRVELEGER